MIKTELKAQSYKFRVAGFIEFSVDINIQINIEIGIKFAVVTSHTWLSVFR